MKKYKVTLTADERQHLRDLIAAGKEAARKLAHARTLLKAGASPGGPAWTDDRIAEAVEVSTDTVARVRQRFVEQSLEAAIDRKEAARPPVPPKLDERAEARLVTPRRAEAVDHAIAGRQAGRVGGRGRRLRRDGSPDASKNAIKPWLGEQWCIPPEADAGCVCAMGDVLDVYHRPHDPARPVVCLDEASKQLVGGTVAPLPPEPGQPERFDYEHVRNGTANLFVMSEPLAGWRHGMVTDRRTAKDFAEAVRWLAEDVYPEAAKLAPVMDNLNTHQLASLYEAFPPEPARRIAERVEVHHAPKHGSWPNVAEIELSVLAHQCLDRRIESVGALLRQLEPWEEERNDRAVGVNWRFTTADARIKLRRLHPAIE